MPARHQGHAMASTPPGVSLPRESSHPATALPLRCHNSRSGPGRVSSMDSGPVAAETTGTALGPTQEPRQRGDRSRSGLPAGAHPRDRARSAVRLALGQTEASILRSGSEASISADSGTLAEDENPCSIWGGDVLRTCVFHRYAKTKPPVRGKDCISQHRRDGLVSAGRSRWRPTLPPRKPLSAARRSPRDAKAWQKRAGRARLLALGMDCQDSHLRPFSCPRTGLIGVASVTTWSHDKAGPHSAQTACCMGLIQTSVQVS